MSETEQTQQEPISSENEPVTEKDLQDANISKGKPEFAMSQRLAQLQSEGGEGGRPRSWSNAAFESRGRSGTLTSVRRITLLAVDASENSQFAFEWFMDHIYRPDDMVVLVHVPEAPKLPTFKWKSGMAPPVDEWKKVMEDMNKGTNKVEELYEQQLITRKIKYRVYIEAFKNPGEGIVKIADTQGVDLICLGMKGSSGIKKQLMGSVTEYVVRHADRPVITIPKAAKGTAIKLMQQRSQDDSQSPNSP